MALKVWLPLNGTLDNLGLCNLAINNTGATIDTNGKIGQCYSFASGNHIDLDSNNVNNHKYSPISISVGAYFTQTDSTERMIINCFESGGCGLTWQNQKVSFAFYAGGYKYCRSNTISLNEWHHFCATYDNTTALMYVDGVLQTTLTATGPITYHNTCPGEIGGNPGPTSFASGNFIGKLNDIRIYDHCLSAKEIKEISQGLILHYKLDGWSGGVGENLLLNSNFSSETTNNGYGVNSSTITHAVKDGKHTGTGTKGTSANIIGQTEQSYSYIANSTINLTVSADVYVEETGTFGVGHGITTTEASGGQSMSGTRVGNSSSNTLSIGGNHISTTLKNAKNAYNGKIVTAFSYTGTTFGITNVKLELGSTATPYSQAPADFGIDTNKIVDSSGYGHDGTATSIISTQPDSARYTISSYLNKKKISRPTGFLTSEDPVFTVSLGFKLYSNITYTSYADLISFTTDSYSSQPFRLELCGSPAGTNLMWFRGPSGNTGGFNVGSATSGWYTLDEWHHIALVSTGNKQYISYFDGQQTNTFNGSSYTGTPTGGVSIGDTGEGTASMNDFRIYSTALSAEDILDLYHTPANIDNLNNAHAFEFEENQTIKIQKNGIFKNQWSELDLMKLQDGSIGAKIYYFDYDEAGAIWTPEEAKGCTKKGKFSCLGDLDKFLPASGGYEFGYTEKIDGSQFIRGKQSYSPLSRVTSGAGGTSTEYTFIDGTSRSNFTGLTRYSSDDTNSCYLRGVASWGGAIAPYQTSYDVFPTMWGSATTGNHHQELGINITENQNISRLTGNSKSLNLIEK